MRAQVSSEEIALLLAPAPNLKHRAAPALTLFGGAPLEARSITTSSRSLDEASTTMEIPGRRNTA